MTDSIGFASDLIPLILNGSKTLTYRLGDKYHFLITGDKINVRNSSTNQIVAKVEITEKDYITFNNLPIDRRGHEIYATKQEQKLTFEKYYGEIKDDDKILILGFKVIEVF